MCVFVVVILKSIFIIMFAIKIKIGVGHFSYSKE